MVTAFLFPTLLALMVAGAVALFEVVRINRGGPDSLTLFMLIFAIQCLFPMTCLALLYFFSPSGLVTGNPFFDRVYEFVGPVELSLVIAFAGSFAAFTYLSYAVVFAGLNPLMRRLPLGRIGVRLPLYVIIVVVGLLSGLYLILSFGGGLVEGYRSLILFRNLDPGIERNFVNANLFSLTQTFLFIGMLAPFVAGRDGRIARTWPLWMAVVVVLALFGVSRRAFFIPIIFFMLVIVLRGGRVGIVFLALASMFAGLVVVFGKTLLAAIAGSGGELEIDAGSAATYLLLFVSDVGITVVESLATLVMIELPYRFGIDHLFSILRRIPSGAMGFETPFLPERIVRHSTEVFLSPDALDIPPGLFGQMWIDFGILGPVFYGIAAGALFGWVEAVRRSFANDWPAAALFSLLVFVLALPVNSGSLDFTFSVDIFVLALLCLAFIRVRRSRALMPETKMEVTR